MSCETCGENRFANVAQSSCHSSKNHAEYSCACKKKFMDTKSLDKHKELMSINAKACPCSACCRSFNTPSDKYQHKRATDHWKPGERNDAQIDTGHVYCDDRCGRSFKSASALADHRRDIAASYGISGKACRVCEKSFASKDRLSQHHTDTGHSSKESPRVKEYIDNFYKSKIAISKDDKKASVRSVDDTLRKIMGHVIKADGGHIFCPNAVKAGSYPVKTKIGKADEFDTNIRCNINPADVRTRGEINYGYEPIDKKMGTANNMNVPMNMKNLPNGTTIPIGFAAVGGTGNAIPKNLTHNGDLIPREIKRDLHGKIKTAIADLGLKNVDLNRNAHGPALTLTIHPGGGRHDISVDIVLSVQCNVSITDNGWPRPDTRRAFNAHVIDNIIAAGMHLVPKGNEMWAVSASKAEKAMLSKIDDGNGCRREVNKVLKKHVQICSSRADKGLPGISSHIIKHQILWSSEKHADASYWHQDNIGNCHVDTMGDLIVALKQGKLPNYFSTSENILRTIDRDVMRELAGYLKVERTKLLHM